MTCERKENRKKYFSQKWQKCRDTLSVVDASLTILIENYIWFHTTIQIQRASGVVSNERFSLTKVTRDFDNTMYHVQVIIS